MTVQKLSPSFIQYSTGAPAQSEVVRGTPDGGKVATGSSPGQDADRFVRGGGGVTTQAGGEEGGGGGVTTQAGGEEGGGGGVTTMIAGEEGGGGVTTQIAGEEGGGVGRFRA